MMTSTPLYPLRFEPVFKSALWGGRRLAELFPGAPAEGPIAEAWVLSDQGENVSRVAVGPLTGTTLRELMRMRRRELLGDLADRHDTFPLLLKFLDARESLSVQVHPNDELARTLASVPRGKTEAWVVLHAEPDASIYAGLRAAVTRDEFEHALAAGTIEDYLHGFPAKPGDCIFIPAGTVHALGAGVTIFEVQQTSDVTYRLYDWGRVDARTGRPRELHVDAALACIDFDAGPRQPTWPSLEASSPVWVERLVTCPYFELRRISGHRPIVAGGVGRCAILIVIAGRAHVRWQGQAFPLSTGDVLLCPAATVPCELVPMTGAVVIHCTMTC
jgi:mannose-6-phosphate isomerase